MASVYASNLLNVGSFRRNPTPNNLILCPFSLYFPWCKAGLRAVKTDSDGDGAVQSSQDPASYAADLLRRPEASSPAPDHSEESGKNDTVDDEIDEKYGDSNAWVNWEDQILEQTVPLVGFVKMILHSGKYGSGDRLSPEHERTILDRLLPYHPDCEKKIGCGVDYITIGYHPNFERSRCLFIVRKDGESVDFSYWKCVKGLIRNKYPLYADTFILRHFKRHKRNDSR